MFIHLVFFTGIWFWHSLYFENREDKIIDCVEKCHYRDNILKEKEILLKYGYCVCKDELEDGVKCEDEDRDGIRFAE